MDDKPKRTLSDIKPGRPLDGLSSRQPAPPKVMPMPEPAEPVVNEQTTQTPAEPTVKPSKPRKTSKAPKPRRRLWLNLFLGILLLILLAAAAFFYTQYVR